MEDDRAAMEYENEDWVCEEQTMTVSEILSTMGRYYVG